MQLTIRHYLIRSTWEKCLRGGILWAVVKVSGVIKVIQFLPVYIIIITR